MTALALALAPMGGVLASSHREAPFITEPVSATEAAATPQDPGKVTVVYDDDPSKLQFLLEADPRFAAP